MKQRTSLSSLKDFVPAELPQMDKRHVDEIDNEDEDEESTTVYVQRLVLGPMDLTSPNRKGSKLIMKPKLASSQLVLEWQAESKVVLNLPFDAVSALQVGL